jgi:diacylglycerol kinase (ATP)
MNNKPKYHFFKNARYALEGLIYTIKTETSFKIELLSIFIILPAILFIEASIEAKLLLFASGVLVLIVELLNSAVENVVDLVTRDTHPLAKSSKDIGAAAVMVSIFLHVVCWLVILFN